MPPAYHLQFFDSREGWESLKIAELGQTVFLSLAKTHLNIYSTSTDLIDSLLAMSIWIWRLAKLFQATARWWNTNGVGNAPIYLYSLLTRLALQEYNAHLLVSLRCCICYYTCAVSFWNWLQGTLHHTVPSLHPSDVQVLHPHCRCICKASCEAICRHHNPRKSLLAIWLPVLWEGVYLVLESPRSCIVAYYHEFQLIFRKHIPDVLPCPTAGMESKSCSLNGMFPVCEDWKTKNPVKNCWTRKLYSPLAHILLVGVWFR